jgi:hypothetical protein
VKVENAAIAARLANDHANRIDAAAVDDRGLRVCRRTRHKAFDMLEPAPNRSHGQRSAALTALQETQRQPQELGLHADALGLRAAMPGRLPNPWGRIDVHAAISLLY